MAGVDDDLPRVGDVYGGVLVPDSPEPGVLARLRGRVEGVYLDDPAVVLGGLGGPGIVEPAVGVGDLQRLRGVVGALSGLALVVRALAVEMLEVNRVIAIIPPRLPDAFIEPDDDETVMNQRLSARSWYLRGRRAL